MEDVKKLVCLLCMTALFLVLFPAPALAEEEEVFSTDQRSVEWNEGWQFREETSDIWQDVSLPHDYSITKDFSTDYEAESGFLPGGTGIYRKTLVLSEEYRDKRIVLEFQGVYRDAEVYVNGRKLGHHPYGYTAFAFDLSNDLFIDGRTENTIEVRVKNELPSSRWYSGSGIYRDVMLTVTDRQYIVRNGIHIETPDLADNSEEADTRIAITVGNDAAESKTLQIRTQILDEAGDIKAETLSDPVTVRRNQTQTVEENVIVNSPDLWSIETPALYTCRTDVLDEDENVIDSLDTRFGYRWMKFDPDAGFFLNGTPVKLKGVCLHHDFGALGAAAWHAALDERLDLLQKMGVNAIRSAHNPADGYFLKACSERGILVIEEAFDTWSNAKNSNINDYSSVFLEEITADNEILGGEAGMMWSAFDAREMVLHSRNEPCMLMYSIGNEILGNISGDTSQYPNYASQLSEWIETFTDTIPVTIADNMTDRKSETQILMDTGVFEAGGVIGLNYATGKTMEAYHKAHPEWPLYGSETASVYGSRGEYSTLGINKKTYQITAYDKAYVEWGMTAENAWKHTISRDYIAGEFVWTGFDYIGEPEPWNGFKTGSVTGAGPLPKSSYFGIIDTAGIPKDSYYFYQSQWRDDITVLHVLPDWNPDNLKKDLFGNVNVTVYTNAPKVELRLNGEPVGTVTAETMTTEGGYTYRLYDGTLSWTKKVRYRDGVLEAIAYDEDGNVIAETSGRKKVQTCGEPVFIRAEATDRYLDADGRDLTTVTAWICDGNGTPVSSDNRTLTFRLEGSGRILGSDSGNPTDIKGYQDNTDTEAGRDAFHGAAAAYIQAGTNNEELVITVSAEGLDDASVRIAVGTAASTSAVPRTVQAVMNFMHEGEE